MTDDIAAGAVDGVDNATVATEDNAPSPDDEAAAKRRAEERGVLEQNVANAQAKIERVQSHLDGAQDALANAEAELAAFDAEGE